MVFVGVGFALCVAANLLSAGLLKLRNTSAVEVTLVRVLPSSIWGRGLDSRRLARAVIALELLTGSGMVLVGTPALVPAATLAFALLVCLTIVSVIAYRRRIPCSCFGAQQRRATKASVARTVGLTVTAGVVVAVALQHGTHWDVSLPAVGIAVVAALVVWLPVILASRVTRNDAASTRNLEPRHFAPPAEVLSLPVRATRTRRRFVADVIGLAAAAIGLVSMSSVSVALASPAAQSCAALNKACFQCCGGLNGWEVCLNCCYTCYISCIRRIYECHGTGYCFGCWNS
jgi:hypothetical protein